VVSLLVVFRRYVCRVGVFGGKHKQTRIKLGNLIGTRVFNRETCVITKLQNEYFMGQGNVVLERISLGEIHEY
jgi:hypothetical protein